MKDERWCADNRRGLSGYHEMPLGAGRYFVRVWRGFVYKEVSNETKFSLKSRNLSRSEEMPVRQGVDIVTCKCNRFSLLQILPDNTESFCVHACYCRSGKFSACIVIFGSTVEVVNLRSFVARSSAQLLTPIFQLRLSIELQ
jgi:hypothetical protein